jgi:hypothetical protein
MPVFVPHIVLCLMLAGGECNLYPSNQSFTSRADCAESAAELTKAFTEALTTIIKESGEPMQPMKIAGVCRETDQSVVI